MSSDQSWLHHAFGFKGRANRAKFWLIPLVPLLLSVTLAVLVFAGSDGPISPLSAGLLVAAAVVTMWVGIAVTVRRLHDRDKSGHWAWLYLGLPAVLNGLDSATGNTDDVTVLALIGLGITIWYFVDCGFLRGTRGPNRYGPDPLGAAE